MVTFPESIKLTKSRHVMVSWTRCAVRLLESDAARCYSCRKERHFAAHAKKGSKLCFRCKKLGHLTRECGAGPVVVIGDKKTVTKPRAEKRKYPPAKDPSKARGKSMDTATGGNARVGKSASISQLGLSKNFG